MDINSLILFEDNHLIILNKPAGILVQGDETGDEPLSEMVKKFIKQRDNKPGNVFCGVTHRIDRPVSGVVIFAKTSKALSRMNELFRLDSIKKTYLAMVSPIPQEESKTIKNYLRKNDKIRKADVFLKQVENAKLSELSYEIFKVKENDKAILLVKPITGRFHQIRAQLAHQKTLIVGDVKYGYKRPNRDKSIFLHAYQIEFEHPVTKVVMKVEAECPFLG